MSTQVTSGAFRLEFFEKDDKGDLHPMELSQNGRNISLPRPSDGCTVVLQLVRTRDDVVECMIDCPFDGETIKLVGGTAQKEFTSPGISREVVLVGICRDELQLPRSLDVTINL